MVAKLAYAEKDFHTYIYREDMVNMFQKAKYSGGGMAFDDVSYSTFYPAGKIAEKAMWRSVFLTI